VLERLLDAVDGISYAVDADDRIVAVGRRGWNRFAIENGGGEPRADDMIGRHLFDFVSDPELRQAYRNLAEIIISTGEPAVIAARWNDPGAAAREVRLSIGRLQLRHNGPGLLFQVQVTCETAPPCVETFDFTALLSVLKQGSDLPIVTMCSYCRQLRRPGSSDEDDWIPVEEYYGLGGSSRVRISHGVCADCDAVRFPDP
jgi:hypothetical protein